MDIPSAKPSAGILAKGYRREHSDVVLKGDYVDRDVRSYRRNQLHSSAKFGNSERGVALEDRP
jgi:hypothetical protein